MPLKKKVTIGQKKRKLLDDDLINSTPAKKTKVNHKVPPNLSIENNSCTNQYIVSTSNIDYIIPPNDGNSLSSVSTATQTSTPTFCDDEELTISHNVSVRASEMIEKIMQLVNEREECSKSTGDLAQGKQSVDNVQNSSKTKEMVQRTNSDASSTNCASNWSAPSTVLQHSISSTSLTDLNKSLKNASHQSNISNKCTKSMNKNLYIDKDSSTRILETVSCKDKPDKTENLNLNDIPSITKKKLLVKVAKAIREIKGPVQKLPIPRTNSSGNGTDEVIGYEKNSNTSLRHSKFKAIKLNNSLPIDTSNVTMEINCSAGANIPNGVNGTTIKRKRGRPKKVKSQSPSYVLSTNIVEKEITVKEFAVDTFDTSCGIATTVSHSGTEMNISKERIINETPKKGGCGTLVIPVEIPHIISPSEVTAIKTVHMKMAAILPNITHDNLNFVKPTNYKNSQLDIDEKSSELPENKHHLWPFEQTQTSNELESTIGQKSLKDVQSKSIYLKPVPKHTAKKTAFPPVPRPLSYPSLGRGPSPPPRTGKMYMGAHISAAGGIHNVFTNAETIKAKSFAMFMRSQRQWNAKPFDEGHLAKYRQLGKEFPSHLILPHGSYLMNVGSSKPELLQKSRNLLEEELQRCHTLGIPHFNFHPGSCVDGSGREDCCRTIADSINLAHQKVPDVIVVLENMCKQGNTIGGDFHELRLIISHVEDRSRVGVCLDTCHAHNAGYNLGTEEGFNTMIKDFDTIIGFQFLRGLHINDSKNEAGAHVDRHEMIGKGHIGVQGMRRIMNCSHFHDMPLILETPYVSDDGYAKEIRMLEAMIEGSDDQSSRITSLHAAEEITMDKKIKPELVVSSKSDQTKLEKTASRAKKVKLEKPSSPMTLTNINKTVVNKLEEDTDSKPEQIQKAEKKYTKRKLQLRK